MSIREKVYELLESIESSAEILDQNITSWEGRKLDREPGNFVSDEITEPLNLDRNRIDNSLPLEISSGAAASNDVADGSAVVIGVDPEEEPADEEDEQSSDEAEVEEEKYYVYGESSFVNEVNKLLKESESDIAGIKKYNMDGRIAAYQVKNALNKVLPETAATGLQVIENVYGNRGEDTMYTVVNYGDAKLPKELDVEVDAETMATLYLGKRDESEPEAHHYFIQKQ